ncbi:hypothetical protein B0T24DRAFT_697142 [Lasiosphaeria ovina]|uniref:Fungal-type protein kinase domain-containing protein n=1 Tax=Lasiosphaeria ovina TaxID=92902 RepID=A0AAE0NFL4_9PEZI|nr:hypothetical protein B0T24DRAFT_697142 [Lasiosphaeria ovina]
MAAERDAPTASCAALILAGGKRCKVGGSEVFSTKPGRRFVSGFTLYGPMMRALPTGRWSSRTRMFSERDEEGGWLRFATEQAVANVARYYHHETAKVNGVVDDVLSNANVRKGINTPAAAGSSSTSGWRC